ncbi:MAG: hypothetical protein KF773_34905 [Deltaproteobacteria bacterium]|nr:hypothetical protein [Deltaproteobacteria bacterium]MCW5804592.1 hypothetical protein [Deltaproteobacteria bacterium]
MRSLLVSLFLVTGVTTAAADDGDDDKKAEGKKDEAIGGGNPDKGTFGIGLMIGEPTGVCGKLYLTDDTALQGAIGSAFFGGGFQAHLDYIWHPSILQARDSFVLAAYVGPGVRGIQYRSGRDVEFNYNALGLRVVGGLLFDFKNPLDAFVEVAGVIEYAFSDQKGGAGFAVNAAAGVRYYF